MDTIARTSRHQWIVRPDDLQDDPNVVERCNTQTLSEALAYLPGVSVESVEFNRSGQLEVPANLITQIPAFVETDLPNYCEVVVHQECPGAHIATIRVWLPLSAWNGRFLGTAGGGNRLTNGLMPGDVLRSSTIAVGVRNGFAAASTDGAVGEDPRPADWQYNGETRDNDRDLIDNWVHRGTHEMTVVGKAVTVAVYGSAPKYSYFQGCSGGGRQAIAAAIYHPSDYDGVWSDVPAINWTRFIPAELWPALVMKELENPLAPAKLEAFRKAAIDDYQRATGALDPFIDSVEPPVYDPQCIVGQATAAGVITHRDAEVMQMIWDGPRSPDGEQLWFGLRPGAASWGTLVPGVGLCVTEDNAAGELEPDPFFIAKSWFQTWLLRDPEWDWTTLTFEEYARLFKQGVDEYSYAAIDDPDLSGLRDSGGKLLITHGTDDQVIFSQGSARYYDRVVDQMGGFSTTADYARLFMCPGDGHGFGLPDGFGTDLATGMIALMEWVEGGVAPQTLATFKHSVEGAILDTRQVAPYGALQAESVAH